MPRNVVSNLDCAPQIKSERERLVRNIGIERRRLCYPWQCFSDLAVAAAERLMTDLQWAPEDVDALVVTEAYVNEGPRMKRLRAAPMGRAYRYQRRMAHIVVEVGEKK